ncbi:fumarylacetoacetate hydrolase family protein [Streptomyces europaeiscabiei]|uniref:2-keto-4-pentenoate hydratase n=1 Tax=Streptomyces europaeiscabiei TaxID=146819 RepID=UPI0029B05DF6|nr:fumarylacetoacetate hydrolase family protein [Streptomyces europaeiscabiei]MDX3697809.1 fumarylacetoacetate hydrolase family protein [Streptomyces europaeiscabiei]
MVTPHPPIDVSPVPDRRLSGGAGERDGLWPPVLGALAVFTSPGRLQDAGLAAAASDLLAAERSLRTIEHLTRRRPGLTIEDAYRIQWTNVQQRLVHGARIAGHKVGLTSLAMQQQIGVDQLDSGVLLDDMLLLSGSTLPLGQLVMPRVEAEIAFRLGSDLHGPDIDVHTVRAAVSEVLLALEVIDTRYGDWRMTLQDSVADNAAAARAVPGPEIALHAGLDLGSEEITVRVDGEVVVSAPGSAVLGGPLNSVMWLVRQLDRYGAGLRRGDLVLAGAVHASLPLHPGTVIEASSPHLPPVSVRAV